MSLVDDFFRDIDRRCARPTSTKVRLRIIGSAALMIRTGFVRGTKDSDVLEASDLTPERRDHLLALAGEGTALHTKHRLYIDIVSSGTPFLPQMPLYHLPTDLNAALVHLELAVLDVVDVVVTKLKRFHANDRSDIEAMVNLDLVPHERLVARFKDAVDYFLGDARAEDLPQYCRNLNTVERDLLGVPETEVDLPEWIGR